MSEAMNLNRLTYFAAVVQTGSFTAAAARLGVTKAVVSQQVTRLEQDTKSSLLVRTTRSVKPTEAGQMLYARCQRILREAEEAFEDLAVSTGAPSGTLRIAASGDFGAFVVAPCAARFTTAYPDCVVELMLTDSRVDLIQNQIDLSVRVGWLEDSSAQARKIGSFQQWLVAAPSMKEDVARLADPSDLAASPFIANAALKRPLSWTFERENGATRLVSTQARMSADMTLAVLAAVRAGAGFSVMPDFLVSEDVAAGRLLRALPDWRLPKGGIYTVYPASRFRPAKVTAFAQMLTTQVKTL